MDRVYKTQGHYFSYLDDYILEAGERLKVRFEDGSEAIAEVRILERLVDEVDHVYRYQAVSSEAYVLREDGLAIFLAISDTLATRTHPPRGPEVVKHGGMILPPPDYVSEHSLLLKKIDENQNSAC